MQQPEKAEPLLKEALVINKKYNDEYGELNVLRGVDFDVARGSVFALLGSNGAGKTTTVRILATLMKADAGTALVHDADVAAQPARVRESISLTGQFAAVDEILSGRENLVLVARLRHLADPGAVADDLLRRFALTDAGARKVSTYSGGMRRRLDLAMSLVGNPSVIFLDEPTTGLDPEGRLEVWQAVRELAAHGTTVLLTTQYLDEAEQLADVLEHLMIRAVEAGVTGVEDGVDDQFVDLMDSTLAESIRSRHACGRSWRNGAGGAGPA